MSGGTLMVWLRVCNASIGVPAAIRPITGTATGRLPSSSAMAELEQRTLPSVPSITLGVKPRRALPLPPPDKLGQLDDLDGAGAIGQAADEAALFQCGDEAVDTGLRAQVERVLHFVEGGRHAGLFQPFVDETQKFILFARKHLDQSPGWRRRSFFERLVQFRDSGVSNSHL